VIVDDKGIKYTWKEYMEKLMNEENEWGHKISAAVKEGPADCPGQKAVKRLCVCVCVCVCDNIFLHIYFRHCFEIVQMASWRVSDKGKVSNIPCFLEKCKWHCRLPFWDLTWGKVSALEAIWQF